MSPYSGGGFMPVQSIKLESFTHSRSRIAQLLTALHQLKDHGVNDLYGQPDGRSLHH